ncbi:hypothetical protein [Nocardia sp. alder85J]|uniref:hypothetical protein n=1 Tax=Nocardia sp. alder85J TaxID=2862949 RepID=UPI001CD482ED|nr:hypothetical protein [Nocardia sp. alder85J]MCX4099297.1 hypothetical protein [Nocardia sp. alder85J]
MHTLLSDLNDLWRVTLAALVFGAGLPAIFAVGVLLQSRTHLTGATMAVRRAAGAGALLCYALVLAVAVTGVLFVAKAFLATRFGIHLFGQS